MIFAKKQKFRWMNQFQHLLHVLADSLRKSLFEVQTFKFSGQPPFPAKKSQFTFTTGKFPSRGKKNSQIPVQIAEAGNYFSQICRLFRLNRDQTLRQIRSNP